MHTKRISAGLSRGDSKWTSTARGPHKKSGSIPLVRVVRDILCYSNTSEEAKKIIHSGKIMVDKKPAKDHKFGVGLMDIVEIPEIKKHYVVLVNKKGLYLKEVKEAEAKKKLCRIVGKKVLDKGRVQYNLHDGCNILSDKTFKVGDTLVLELPKRKAADSVEYAKGCQVIIVHGRHTGTVGVVEDISEGNITRKPLSKIGDIQTLTDYVFAIGKYKTLID